MPEADDYLVRASGIGVRIGESTVLHDIDLGIRGREIVSLIGPNGAGKTTLIRVLLGLLQPSAGTVTRRPSLRVGYVPQRLHIDPVLPLSVGRFLDLGGRVLAAERDSVLGEVGVPAIAQRPVQEISGGEFQRVLIARALLRNPDLLVLDEPVQGVDITGQSEIYGLIARIRDARGCGVLLVSHDLHVVMAATDRVICLNRHVCCAGRPETVSQHPEYIALFGPGIAASLAVYAHGHDHAHDAHGSVRPLEQEHRHG